MCDTLVIRGASATWFAKNSDREPEEPQVIEVHEPVRGDGVATMRATYMDIPQVPDRFGAILSRPIWMWGAEMGVNDQGVVIGNEAVFSKLVDKTGEALLGMDLLRLGLERGATARAALDIITALLEEHGQAGPAGYKNKNARYDNSFLIADANEAWVLETAGKNWVAKRIDQHWAISNTYSLKRDYDLHSPDIKRINFKRTYERIVMPYLARGKDRSALSTSQICAVPEHQLSLAKLANMLRAHFKNDGFGPPSRANVCMHARGFTCPSQSTASLIVKLSPGEAPRVAATGTPLPCISLFKPIGFDAAQGLLLTDKTSNDPTALWTWGAKAAIRAAANPTYAQMLRGTIAGIEPDLLEALERGDLAKADEMARSWSSTHDSKAQMAASA